VQLRRLEDFVRRRREIADGYRAALAGAVLRPPPDAPGRIYFRFVVDAVADPIDFRRRAGELGIGCERPVHTPLHRLLGLEGFPQTETAWRHTISLPIYPALAPAEENRILSALPGLAQGRNIDPGDVSRLNT
jgi:dTDP-4-amino-4,6-dideoxygalactose transaminase